MPENNASETDLPVPADGLIGDILDPGERAQRVREIFARSDEEAKKIVMEADAYNTRRSYESHVRQFWRWASAYKGEKVVPQYPIPPDAAKLFLTDFVGAMPAKIIDELGLRVTVGGKTTVRFPRSATILSWVAALSRTHREKHMESPFDTPALQELVRAIRRRQVHKDAPVRKALPITRAVLKLMVAACERRGTLAGARDAAILLVGFGSGGRRRSELSEALLEDLTEVPSVGGYALGMRHMKRKTSLDIEYVPVFDAAAVALKKYMELAGLAPGGPGAIFRRMLANGKIHPSQGLTGHAIGEIIQDCAADVCLNPNGISGHSLRHGFITEAKNSRIDLRDVMALSKHRDVKTVMGYQSIGDMFNNRAARLTRKL